MLPPARATAPLWPWLAGAAGLLALVLAALSLRRRGADEVWRQPVGASPHEAEIGPASASSSVDLMLALRPVRAGLNLISATADCEVIISNLGGREAEDVRADVQLFSAREERSDDLAAFFAAPITRPATPAFAIGPGEERRFRIVAALPHESIRALAARGRPMFVPLVAVAARFRVDGGEHSVGQAFVLGVERVEGAKLAPMWLDTPPRQYDNVAARAHGEVVRG